LTTEENKIEGSEDEALSAEEQEAVDLADEKKLAGHREPATLEQMKVGALVNDRKIQRRLDTGRVNNIIKGFDPEALGTFTVSRREDGKYYTLDGQHRRAAMELLGLSENLVDVKVFRGLTTGQEALLFRLLNNTKKPQPLDLFKVKILEGDPKALKMWKLLTGYEWRFQTGVKDGNFMAVKTLERMFEVDEVTAEAAVNILCQAWGNRIGTLNDGLLAGMGRLLLRRGDKIDPGHLIRKLQEVPGGPREVINKGLTLKEALNMRVAQAMAMVLVEIYNKGLRSNQLDAWKEK
jgi:hypothetical protein